MEEEMILKTTTWDLVTAPHTNIVGCKWIFKTKLKKDGSIEKYKARLVGQGYSQVKGLDYEKAFSPSQTNNNKRDSCTCYSLWLRPQAIRSQKYVPSRLFERRCVCGSTTRIPAPNQPHLVSKLYHSLYGLKQAQSAWFERLSQQLLRTGFSNPYFDPFLFLFTSITPLILMLVYADDIIMTSTNKRTM